MNRDRLTTWLVTGGAFVCLVALELLGSATTEVEPEPADYHDASACDLWASEHCYEPATTCEADPRAACLEAAMTCEAARACEGVIE